MKDRGEMKLDHANDNEEIPGLHFETLHNRGELRALREDIAAELRYDVLTDTFNAAGSTTAWKEDIKHLEDEMRHSSLHSGTHEVVLLAKVGEKIVGLLAIETREAGKHAEILEFRTKHNRQQRTIMGQLIAEAREALSEDQFRQLFVEADSVSDDLSSAMRKNPYFLKKVAKSHDHETPPGANGNLEDRKHAA